MSRTIFAAGTVLWREVDGQLMVLLVHRTQQHDVSFPKGKLDRGESLPQAAVRETLEETGLRVKLGVNLGTIHYRTPNGDEKTVQYWAARVKESAVHTSTFRPNREISALEWVPLSKVAKRLTYPADRELFGVFEKLAARQAIDTFSIVLLRHAKAEQRSALWPEDRLRPLADTGEEQAETLVPILESFGPGRLYTSTATRCVDTATPLAHHLGKTLRTHEELSQDAWDAGSTRELRQLIGAIVRRGKNALICTHRPVLPDVAREIVLATGSLPGDYLAEATSLPPGAFSVFHLSKKHPGAGILAIETYPLKH